MEADVAKIAAVLPCYRVKDQILSVLAQFGPEVHHIIVVDDQCPERSGAFVEEMCQDPRVVVVRHAENQGVGGATLTGMRHAAGLGCKIAVKVDGDGQMDPHLLPLFVRPILEGRADYVKGNRFYRIDGLAQMPKIRLFGNAGLSLLTKASSGYWDLFDPTNGYTALHLSLLKALPTEKIAKRYFFESDILFRLYTIRARVMDVPMTAKYGDEESNLNVGRVFLPFLAGNVRNYLKRLFYAYFLRDFSVGTIYIVFGLILALFGTLYGGYQWWWHAAQEIPTPAGTVMVAALPLILGFQLLLSFLAYDVGNVPKEPIHKVLDTPLQS